MSISVDYDLDIADSREVLAPLQQILEPGALIKTVDIFVRFQTQEPRFMWWGGSMQNQEIHKNWTVAYFPTELIPESDLDLFNYLRSIETMPLVRAEVSTRKKKASPEELKKIEEWEEVFHLPVESEKVQALLSNTRLQAEQAAFEKQNRELQKISNSYNQVIREINSSRAPKELSEIVITVVFAKQTNFNQNFVAKYRITTDQNSQWVVR